MQFLMARSRATFSASRLEQWPSGEATELSWKEANKIRREVVIEGRESSETRRTRERVREVNSEKGRRDPRR